MVGSEMVGQVVLYRVQGTTVFWGLLEYVRGGWAGIRQPHEGGRLDEAPAALVVPDPT